MILPNLDLELVILQSLCLNDLLQLLNLLISCQQLEWQTRVLNCPVLVGLILPLLKACELSIHLLLPAVHANLTIGDLSVTFILDELLELFNSHIFKLYICLGLAIDAIIGFQLLLELNNGFISFIEPASQSNHDISLLEQELLVSINLLLVFLNLDSLLLNFLHFFIEFHSHNSLFFF